MRIASARGSIVRTNKVGDKGHPCLVSFVILNQLDTTPLIRTYYITLGWPLGLLLQTTSFPAPRRCTPNESCQTPSPHPG
ncbi:hypothetical protein GDO78_014858 [Eleutherodactylus coqui]|uniref:Uncharacterized protein n=1 Tax=Eleutherodactylus coqui TaxID=57060 RepID=A0A8J6B686_ELECQ|nr:hypothetical protein GDO78_014858 [Eleutherodactylus coqui]